jgi:hypothetical protein
MPQSALFSGDVVRLLQSLPDGGSLSIHFAPRAGTARTGMFSLAGLETLRAKQPANGHAPSRNPTTDAVR